jgi:hypothetical protein
VADVRSVLQVTAPPIPDVPFFRQGYGHLDVSAAVALAHQLTSLTPAEVGQRLETLQTQRDSQVLAGLAQPMWTTAETIYYLPETDSIPVKVEPGARRLKIVSGGRAEATASPTFSISVYDAHHRKVAHTQPHPGSPPHTVVLDIDLTKIPSLAYGDWRVIVGDGTGQAGAHTHLRTTVAATFTEPPPSTPASTWRPALLE